MGTLFSTIITGNFSVEQSDERLRQLLVKNPAGYFRKTANLLMEALPLFNRPGSVIRTWLLYTAPVYGDYTYTAPTDETAPISVDTGLMGFALCSAGIVNATNGSYTPVSVTYNAETGAAVIQASLTQGQRVDFDFYTDGEFINSLTPEMRRIAALCMQLVWETRFANDYLIQTPKIKDKTFSVEAEANTSRAGTERIKLLRDNLNGQLMAFEQSIAYSQQSGMKAPKFPTA